MYHGNLWELIGKDVVVVSSGMIYRGRLIEVSDTEVFLQGEMGWMQLAVENVTEINPA